MLQMQGGILLFPCTPGRFRQDWQHHKKDCRELARGQSIRIPTTVKAVLFPVEGGEPRIIEVPYGPAYKKGTSNIVGYEAVLRPLFGPGGHPWSTAIDRDGFKEGGPLGRSLSLFHNDHFKEQKSPLNKCIDTISHGKGYKWGDNLVGLRKSTSAYSRVRWEDVTQDDVRAFKKYFAEGGDGNHAFIGVNTNINDDAGKRVSGTVGFARTSAGQPPNTPSHDHHGRFLNHAHLAILFSYALDVRSAIARPSPHKEMASRSTSTAVWLKPRPLASCPSSFLLLPLLPSKSAPKPLPSDVWSNILEFAFASYGPKTSFAKADAARLRLGLLLVSKDIHAVALPLFYAHTYVSSLSVLERLTARLHAADQQWDSIRRIPYSAPGRWIQTLDMTALRCDSPEDALRLDIALHQISSLVPLMANLVMSPQIMLSRRALSSFAEREGASNLRSLSGLQLWTSGQSTEDAFVDLLRACTRLEELEIFGSGVDSAELLVAQDDAFAPPPHFRPLHLPFLRRLAAFSMPTSPVLRALLLSPLPALRHLTLTPYDERSVPASLIPRFITTHGAQLTSLYLYTVKQHLSLELPLPILALTTASEHQLEILSVARPSPEFLDVLEGLLPKLPRLRFVRARDVKWLRGGMSARAQQAGVQGEMLVWKRKLGRRGIQLLDAEWKASAE
ncbi:hypothetical protein ONZ51_g11578 [Trametes cubensis]|uniref:MYND-type domain-containing protein n=1 Tax=Trametes cubensis TaxID=1111947 RepID=A0AAD7X7Q5_9APHY|nr:hypothetical protein ONZ51_g11578 [Trametes cubensis]